MTPEAAMTMTQGTATSGTAMTLNTSDVVRDYEERGRVLPTPTLGLFSVEVVTGDRIRLVPRTTLAARLLQWWLRCEAKPVLMFTNSPPPVYARTDDEKLDLTPGVSMDIEFHSHPSLSRGTLGSERGLTAEQYERLLAVLNDETKKPSGKRKRGRR